MTDLEQQYVDGMVDMAVRFGNYTPDEAAQLRADLEASIRTLHDAINTQHGHNMRTSSGWMTADEARQTLGEGQ